MGVEIDPLRVSFRENGIVVATVNRPNRLNSLSLQVLRDLAGLLDDISRRNDLSCLILTGEGIRAFGAGLDIKEAPTLSAAETEEERALYEAAELTLARLPVVSIAAVEGVAAGGSLQFALACDFIVVADGARLGMPELSAGRPCIMGSYLLSSRVPYGTVATMVLGGQWIDASHALSSGLATEVVPQGQALERSLTLAQEVIAAPPQARRATVEWMREIRWGARPPIEKVVDAAEPILSALSQSDEAAERDRQFRERATDGK